MTRRIPGALVGVALSVGLLVISSAVPVNAWEGRTGRAVDGTDLSRLLPPPGATVAGYQNRGYQLHTVSGEVWVEVDVSPLGSEASWRPPGAWSDEASLDPMQRLVRGLSAGADTEFDVSSRILGWVARSIEYHLDRAAPQDAASVLERRSAYCTGIARLTVALLHAAGLEAREVAGYVLSSDGPDRPHGFHRWVETRFSDVGWVFSDPLHSHHYVPATYVRLGSDQVIPEAGLDGLLMERRDRLVTVDLFPTAPLGVRARRNDRRQHAAALRVEVDGASTGLAVLEGRSNRFTHSLARGVTTFLGLEPGIYRLEVLVAGWPPIQRALDIRDRLPTRILLDGPGIRDNAGREHAAKASSTSAAVYPTAASIAPTSNKPGPSREATEHIP